MQARAVLTTVAGLLAVGLAAGIVAGCTGSSAGSSGTAAVHGAAAGKVAAQPAVGGSGGYGTDATAPAAGPPQAKDAAAVTSTAQIRTAEMTVAVRGSSRVAAQANAADAIAARTGGEVTADERTAGAHASATVSLRVPPTALQPTLTALARLGTERSRHLSTTDVTEEVADVNSRVASARSAIDRLRVLYGKAVKVADVISIEDELSGRESDLESLEARQRALAAQTSMATITLTLVTAAPAVAHAHHARGGFVGGVEKGWGGFTSAAAGVATALGAALPFLAVLLVVAFALRLAWSRLPRLPRPARRPSPAPEP